MSSLGGSHIDRQADGSCVGIWGLYQLRSAFQPIFEFSRGKLPTVAFEALIRPSRNGSPISPYEFFSTVSDHDRFKVETLTRTLHVMNAGEFLGRSVSVFINFDPGVFMERSICDAALYEMRHVLETVRIDASRVVCEVTEHQSASRASLNNFVDALRSHGFRIAVDDYGADDSDLNRVQELRPDIIKFDAGWTSRYMVSSAGAGLLKAMVSNFHDQGIHTLFEGLEESWQLEVAEACGVSMVQGYVLGRPQTVPSDFSAFIGAQGREDIGTTFVFDGPDATRTHRSGDPQSGRWQRPARTFGRKVTG